MVNESQKGGGGEGRKKDELDDRGKVGVNGV